VPGAEIVAGPEVEAAGARIFHYQGAHGDGKGNHEKQGAEHPEGE